jgi:DNA repair protein RadC
MPGRAAERRGIQAHELRSYWDNPIGLSAFQASLRRGGSSPPQPITYLEEHQHSLPMSAGTPHIMREGLSQPALPFTWYTAEHGVHEAEAGAKTTPSLNHLQQHAEQRGVQTLSNAELLALVLRTGAGSEAVVERIHSLLASYSVKDLLHVDFGEFSQQYGLSRAKVAQLQSLLELSQRLTRPSVSERYQIKSPRDAATLLMPEMAHLDHEEMRVLVLDTKNGVVANLLLYQGTVNSSVLRAGEVFRPAVTRKCPGVIIAHNHPSGDPTPSPEDMAVTEQIVQAGKVLDVELIDHLIIGSNRFLSLKEKLRW